jgi:serine/threonine protein kinase/Tfp pilus assembly protein PilF
MADSQRVRSVFLAAVERHTPDQWGDFLERACGGEADLRQRVEVLLRAHEQANSVLDVAAAPPAETTDHPAGETAGTTLGAYKLLQLIGEGGMGVVWMAEQSEPIQRRVALKVIKEGMDSRHVLARFEAERQALALMDHPNIAKVLDAGQAPSGRPYFVMELVKGEPITAYCDEKRLGVHDRLALFGDVCRAVQHAHQKGIIHRDIKPSNVMVAPYDGKPVVKVIDFGVAKAAGQRLTDKTLFTGFGAIVGTPEYMSPEQAEVNNQDIDTRTDIYSLGVLLYELLTGTTPLTRKRARDAALLELLRVIREEEPPKPSTRLSEWKDSLPLISAQRQMEPARLAKMVRGELDWIVMKALDKDRGRRYETANGLAMDVQRYLVDEPVQACPPSASYRLRKMAHRNKGAMSAAAAILVFVAAGAAVSTWQAIRATGAEHDTRDALARVTAEQAKTQQALAAARDALDVLTDDVVETMFARQPELDEAEKAFLRTVLKHHEAVAAQEAETAAAQFVRAKGQFKVAHLRELLGEPAAAITGYQQAALLLKGLADRHPDEAAYRHKLARANGNLGILLAEAGKETDAEAALRLGIALRTTLAEGAPGNRDFRSEVATNYNDLAHVMERQGKPAEAENAYRKALDLQERLVAEPGAAPVHHRDLARIRSNVGQWLRTREKYAEAEKLYRDAIEVQEEQADRYPAVPKCRRQLADSYQGHGIVLAELGKEDESEEQFGQSVAARQRLVDTFPAVRVYRRELAGTYHDLAYLQSRRKKLAEAERSYQRAVELTERLIAEGGAPPDYRKFLSRAFTNLGKLLQDQKKDAEAEKAYRASLKLDLGLCTEFPKSAEHHVGAANVLMMLALIQHGRKDARAAVPPLLEAQGHLKAALDVSPKNPHGRQLYRDTLRLLAKSYYLLDDYVKLAAISDDLVNFAFEPPGDTFDAATMLSSCVTLVNKDTGLGEAKRKQLEQVYTERGLARLGQAIECGFKDAERMQNDPRLEPLRARPEFRKLLDDLQAKKS